MAGGGRPRAPRRGQVVQPAARAPRPRRAARAGVGTPSPSKARVARRVVGDRDAPARPRAARGRPSAAACAARKSGAIAGEQRRADGGIEQPLAARERRGPVRERQRRGVGEPARERLEVRAADSHRNGIADLARPARAPRRRTARRRRGRGARCATSRPAGIDDRAPRRGRAAGTGPRARPRRARRPRRRASSSSKSSGGASTDAAAGERRGRSRATPGAGSAATGEARGLGRARGRARPRLDAAAKRGPPSSHQRAAQPSSRRQAARSSAGERVDLARLGGLAVELPAPGSAGASSAPRSSRGHSAGRTPSRRIRTSGAAPSTGTTWPARAHQPRPRYARTSRPSAGSIASSAGRISPASTPGPSSSAKRPRRTRRARGKRSRKLPLASSTEPPEKLVDPDPVAEPAQHLFGSRRARAETTTLEPRGSGGSAGPARRPWPVEPAAAACARSVSRDPTRPECDELDRRAAPCPRRRARSRRRGRGAARRRGPRARRRPRAPRAARESGETPASASSGWPRISWKSTAAQPPASTTSVFARGDRHRRGRAARPRRPEAVLSSSGASSASGAWKANARCSSPRPRGGREACPRARAAAADGGRRPAGPGDHAALGLPQTRRVKRVPRARGGARIAARRRRRAVGRRQAGLGLGGGRRRGPDRIGRGSRPAEARSARTASRTAPRRRRRRRRTAPRRPRRQRAPCPPRGARAPRGSPRRATRRRSRPASRRRPRRCRPAARRAARASAGWPSSSQFTCGRSVITSAPRKR